MRRWFGRLSSRGAIALACLIFVGLYFLGNLVSYQQRMKGMRNLASHVLRAGMTRDEAVDALVDAGLDSGEDGEGSGPGSPDDPTQAKRSYGFAVVPSPGIQIVRVVAKIEGGRVISWDVESDTEGPF